ncbi:hypothetical protein [Sphingomonas sp.]|jgi:hypothetical protein|uniref:hypothetical protein n=1 Tax=Sphingomonas sp. TaxID=28214 RepID=UPI002D7F43A5|nr:hypothetical protein [Sphingomonas sp.]HEU0045804.1 hypothetical protein [Sphingomonas sp.]
MFAAHALLGFRTALSSRGGISVLIAQGVCEPVIGFGHLGELAKTGSDVPLEASLVMNARCAILILREQLLQPRSKSPLIIGTSTGLQNPADPFLGGSLVVIVVSRVPAFVRGSLVKPCSL